MAPKSTTRGTTKSAAKTKAMPAAPAAASHSSKENFNEEEEMRKFQDRLLEKPSVGGLPEKAEKPVGVATPQKSKSYGPAPSPTHEGVSRGGIVRAKPATPSKDATPIKSPVPKKNKVAAASPDVRVEIDLEPAASDAAAAGGNGGSGDVSVGTQDQEKEAPQDVIMSEAAQEEGGCMQTEVSNRSLRRIETKTTVPDIGLECHLFVQQLTGDHDMEGREKLHAKIYEWIDKMSSWFGGGGWITDTDPVIAPHVHVLVQLINEIDPLIAKVEEAKEADVPKIATIEKAYETMYTKIVLWQDREDLKVIEAKKESLEKWRTSKLEDIRVPTGLIQEDLTQLRLKIRERMDLMIDAVRQADAQEPCEAFDQDHVMEDLAVMEELEVLMANCYSKKNEKNDDSILREPTLVLGCNEPTPAPGQASHQTTPNPSPTKHGEVDLAMSEASPSEVPPGDAKRIEMEFPSPEEVALKHISNMEDGPLKSSLLALCEASVAKGLPSSLPPDALQAAARALERKDTTQLQVEAHEQDPSAILQEDGTYLYAGPNGRLETWKERQARLQHNQKMVFNRSFRHAPEEVVRAAANKRYNHNLIGELYEDWLSSGKCWLRSATYLNATRTKEERKRGTYVMRDYKWLAEKYGSAVADGIVESKKEMQKARKNGDPMYIMANPDVPNSEEHQLYRVFDSMQFEDEESNKWETGLTTNGDFSEEQTKDMGSMILRGAKDFGLVGSANAGPVAGHAGDEKPPSVPPPAKIPRVKKEVGLKKQVGSKISMISTKLTELKVLRNKVQSSPLSETMKNGYLSELDCRTKEFSDGKITLEGFYMNEKSDAEIAADDELKGQFQKALASVDSLVPNLSSTMRTVKLAIEPPKPKAKGKPKLKRLPNEHDTMYCVHEFGCLHHSS